MSDCEEEGGLLAQLLKRHRAEKKELQNEIQGLKKSVSKGDKKKKKEVTEEIARLEADLEKKHKEQLSELEKETPTIPQPEPEPQEENSSTHKVSRAQKRRDKKELQEKERLSEIAREREENKEGPRNRETLKIIQLLQEKKLKLKEVPSDGNCLFSAVSHQIPEKDVWNLRKKVASYIQKHPDDYLPFLSNEQTGEPMNSDEFQDYLRKMAETPAWGGQIELRALSNLLEIPIKVIQAEGPVVEFGPEGSDDDNNVVITYHRHMYGLGEHYNSTDKITS